MHEVLSTSIPNNSERLEFLHLYFLPKLTENNIKNVHKSALKTLLKHFILLKTHMNSQNSHDTSGQSSGGVTPRAQGGRIPPPLSSLRLYFHLFGGMIISCTDGKNLTLWHEEPTAEPSSSRSTSALPQQQRGIKCQQDTAPQSPTWELMSFCSLISAGTVWKNDGTEDEIMKHVQCTSNWFLYTL